MQVGQQDDELVAPKPENPLLASFHLQILHPENLVALSETIVEAVGTFHQD
jgi:hypothetical protein